MRGGPVNVAPGTRLLQPLLLCLAGCRRCGSELRFEGVGTVQDRQSSRVLQFNGLRPFSV